jgi:hypothetical protein
MEMTARQNDARYSPKRWGNVAWRLLREMAAEGKA